METDDQTPEANSAAVACSTIHTLVDRLPVLRDPKEVPFENGIYFFYQDDERSQHGSDGRIVRVGMNDKPDRLALRLRNHYAGSKKNSVFRKYLGGALLRRENPSHSCLQPLPGRGHWEHQKGVCCEKCRPVEDRVTDLIRQRFCFRCIWVEESRTVLERKLLGSLSRCPICHPSKHWLGLSAYSEAVRESGLWNTRGVYGAEVMTAPDLELLVDLIARTLTGF